MSSLGKLVSYMREGRFDQIGKAVSERVPRWLFYSGRAFVFTLSRSEWATKRVPISLPTGYRCRLATRDEMPACSRVTGFELSEYYRRYDAGDLCYGVFTDDRPVNINWVHSGICYIRGMGYDLDGASAEKYIYGIMTDPAERGKGLYKNCLTSLAEYLFLAGAERLIQMVEDGNTPVLNTLPQLGYTRIQEIRHSTVFGINRTRAIDFRTGRDSTRWYMRIPNDRFVI